MIPDLLFNLKLLQNQPNKSQIYVKKLIKNLIKIIKIKNKNEIAHSHNENTDEDFNILL
jgi:hypothetical protein